MTMHTPGPWTVRFIEPWTYDVVGPDRVITTVLGDEANARLIAEAPALLAELERLVAGCPFCGDNPQYPPGVTADGRRCPYCFPARDLIRRARAEDTA